MEKELRESIFFEISDVGDLHKGSFRFAYCNFRRAANSDFKWITSRSFAHHLNFSTFSYAHCFQSVFE